MAAIKWSEGNILKAYMLAKDGKTMEQIADAMGVSEVTIQKWRKSKPAFKQAIEQGNYDYKNVGVGKVFSIADYVYERLPADLQPLWEKLEAIDKAKSGVEKIDVLLKDRGLRVRQHLFIYAWISSGFILNKALRKVGVSGRTFYQWKEEDPEFAEMINQVTFLMRCFVQDRLFEQAMMGDTQIIIFLAKTYLRKWGFSEKVDIDVNMNMTGEIKHNHTASLNLDNVPLELKRQFLEYIRQPKQFVEAETIDESDDTSNEPTGH